ncbi:TetR/AcrR family transcriptional regulator [Streptomyces triticisoli]|uniref:TetR/AcrR family transcriptional regulator n=1 Tax=Streptomyces triticisoli TaxID=2182797 RepID=UPI001E3FFC3C|nr:hypothetical protein [Streptomyces triticisoli]
MPGGIRAGCCAAGCGTLRVRRPQDQAVAGLVKEMMEREMIDKIAARLGGVDARERAGAFCARIAGLVVTRCILRLALRESPRHQHRTAR